MLDDYEDEDAGFSEQTKLERKAGREALAKNAAAMEKAEAARKAEEETTLKAQQDAEAAALAAAEAQPMRGFPHATQPYQPDQGIYDPNKVTPAPEPEPSVDNPIQTTADPTKVDTSQ